jgi:hypothetical protein
MSRRAGPSCHPLPQAGVLHAQPVPSLLLSFLDGTVLIHSRWKAKCRGKVRRHPEDRAQSAAVLGCARPCPQDCSRLLHGMEFTDRHDQTPAFNSSLSASASARSLLKIFLLFRVLFSGLRLNRFRQRQDRNADEDRCSITGVRSLLLSERFRPEQRVEYTKAASDPVTKGTRSAAAARCQGR